MSCKDSAETAGLMVGLGKGAIVAFHGSPDEAYKAANDKFEWYTFENTEAVIEGLRQLRLPDKVRRKMLENLAMNGVPADKIDHLLLRGEPALYERYQGVQKILSWANLPHDQDPRGVTKLRLKGLGIDSLSGISEFHNLTVLDLENNELENLPKEIGRLPYLGELNLAHNRLKGLPKSVGRLKNLYELNLGYNLIEDLPEEVGDLENLKQLYLRNNLLQEIPKAISELGETLTVLHLSNNPLKEATLPELYYLDELDLSSTQLRAFPRGLHNALGYLDLCDNGIESLEPEDVAHLSRLRVLDLSGNPLETLPDDIADLGSLVWLGLERTQLQAIPVWLREMQDADLACL
jgi:Leucine-rich repeat (LRR) protein